MKGRQGEEKSRLRVLGSPRPRVPSPRLPIPPFPHPPIITLLTDFGALDYFVGSMKGVILSANPQASIVDITHEIPPQGVESGAFTLLAVHGSFPAGTIHVAVVDPGVGSSRRAILVHAGGQFCVGPDNGIFSYIYDLQPDHRVFHLTNEEYFRHPVSATFHGRDIFAPVAAALSMGVNSKDLGVEIKDYVRLESLAPKRLQNGKVEGRIINIDRFGNCITNLTHNELTTEMIAAGAQLKVKGKTIKWFKRFFADEKSNKQKLFAIWGSAGFLEIAAFSHSAAKVLDCRSGDAIIVKIT